LRYAPSDTTPSDKPLSNNSFSVSIPQIILPSGHDTLDFANRAEWLGIALYGSRSSAPSASAVELSNALLRVLDDREEAASTRRRVKALGRICDTYGGGKKACAKIIEIVEGGKFEWNAAGVEMRGVRLRWGVAM
jgi:UDP:flavonoid glycosyltransferase YjiC (YdhE family)